jgi:hypothetical protein
LIAEGHTKGVVGLRQELFFNDFTKDEIKTFLLKKEYRESQCERLPIQYDVNISNCIQEVRRSLRNLEYQETESKY